MSEGGTPRLAPEAASKLRETARVIGWGLVLYAAVMVANAYLLQNPTGSLAVQAAIAELGAGRLAVAWSDPRGPLPTPISIARRANTGAALGLAAGAAVLGFSWVTHATTVASGTPAPMMLPMGLLVAGLLAMRDELLLRGVVLRALQRSVPAPVALLVCGLAGAAARLGTVPASADITAARLAMEALGAGLLAVSFAALWARDRGAWLAWGAHTGWLWATGSLSRGGLVDLRWAEGAWGGGDAGIEGSGAAAVMLAGVAIAALAGSRAGALSDTIGPDDGRRRAQRS